MPEQQNPHNTPSPRSQQKSALVFSAPATALTDAQIAELQSKYGVTLHLQSTANAVTAALGRLADDGVQLFDKTNPGYDRVYDKQGISADPMQQVINPVDLQTTIEGIASKIVNDRISGS
jgi:hypothetical protein